MLNKEVCFKCCSQWHREHRFPYDYEIWTHEKDMEKQWQQGWAPCLDRYSGMLYRVDIKEKPPHECPYELEHLVNA